MDEKKYQVKIYDNERIIVSMHSYNPFKSRTELNEMFSNIKYYCKK